MSLDVRFASGTYGQWAHHLGGTNSSGSNVGYAVKVQPVPSVGFMVSLRKQLGDTSTSTVMIPLKPALGVWYSVSVVAGPPSGAAAPAIARSG